MEPTKFDNLSQFTGIKHGYSNTDYGNMSFRYGSEESVKENRKKLFDDLGINENQVAVTSLVHGNQIIDVTEGEWGRGIENGESSLEGDVLVTSQPDTYLFMVVADCLALFFYEPEKQVCALAHAGWRGVDLEVPRLTVEYLVKQKGCDPKKLVVGMAPALQTPSSNYDKDRFERFDDPRWQKYIQKDGDRGQINWVGFAYDQLVSAGVKPEKIERSEVNTRTNSKFFSHRRSTEEGDPEGRFGCVIGLSRSI